MMTPKLSLALLLLTFGGATEAVAETTTSSSTSQVIRRDADDESKTSSTEIQNTQVRSYPPVAPPPPLQQSGQQPGEMPPTAVQPVPPQTSFEQTVITEKHPNEGGLSNQAVGINPQFGVLALADVNGNTTSRGIAGMTIDINGLSRLQTSSANKPFLGPSVGILYSHLGTPTSDFLGLNSASGNDEGTNLLLFPFDAKAGYTFNGVFRPSVHLGGTLIYNNTSIAPTGVELSNSSTSLRFNIGMDFEFAVGRTVAILLRPDWVFAPNTTVFAGTLGLVFPIS